MERSDINRCEEAVQVDLQVQDPGVTQEQRVDSVDLQSNQQLQESEAHTRVEASELDTTHETQKVMQREKEPTHNTQEQDSLQKSETNRTSIHERRKLAADEELQQKADVNMMVQQKDERPADSSFEPAQGLIQTIQPENDTIKQECDAFAEELFDTDENTAMRKGAETPESILRASDQDSTQITQQANDVVPQECYRTEGNARPLQEIASGPETSTHLVYHTPLQEPASGSESILQAPEQNSKEITRQEDTDAIHQECKIIVDEPSKPISEINLTIKHKETLEESICVSIEDPTQTAEQEANDVVQQECHRTEENAPLLQEIASGSETLTHILVYPRRLREPTSDSEAEELPVSLTDEQEVNNVVQQECHRTEENTRLLQETASGPEASSHVVVYPRRLQGPTSDLKVEELPESLTIQILKKRPDVSPSLESRTRHQLEFERLPPVPEEDLPAMAAEIFERRVERNRRPRGARRPTGRREYEQMVRERLAFVEELQRRCIKFFYSLLAGGILVAALYFLIDFLERKYDTGGSNDTSPLVNFHVNFNIPEITLKPDRPVANLDVNHTNPGINMYSNITTSSINMYSNITTSGIDMYSNITTSGIDMYGNITTSGIDMYGNITTPRIDLDVNTTPMPYLVGKVTPPINDLNVNSITPFIDLYYMYVVTHAIDLNVDLKDMDVAVATPMNDLNVNMITPFVDLYSNVLTRPTDLNVNLTDMDVAVASPISDFDISITTSINDANVNGTNVVIDSAVNVTIPVNGSDVIVSTPANDLDVNVTSSVAEFNGFVSNHGIDLGGSATTRKSDLNARVKASAMELDKKRSRWILYKNNHHFENTIFEMK